MPLLVKIDPRSKEAKALIEYLKKLSFVTIEESEKSPYNAEFVKKISKARSEKTGKVVTAENLWQSIKS